MKQEVDCGVIRDLLPLYEDGVASEETQALVREHLKDCPDCREELRKMRTPISVPPDEDEEAVKRFLEFRAQVRRKQNVKIARVVSVLVLIAVFFLWYLRPRSWTEIAGTDPVGGLNALLSTDRVNFEANPFEEKLWWDIWRLNEEDVDTGLTDTFLDALNRYTYRSSLSNLLNNTPFHRNGHTIVGSTGHLSFFLYTQDHQECISFILWSNGDMTVDHMSASSRSSLYRTDPALYEEMAGMIREYGWLEE